MDRSIPAPLLSKADLVLFSDGKSQVKLPTKSVRSEVNRGRFGFTKQPQKESISTILSPRCEAVPPPDIPEVHGELEEYIVKLTTTSPDILSKGDFQFFVPVALTERYHNLSMARALHVRNAFCFAWANYRDRAWGRDEIQPITGTGNSNWGGMGVTLIDSLDTLYLMGLTEELNRSREFVKDVSFDVDHYGSVFESDIRLLGGLEAAYDLTKDSVFLDKALDVGKRLLPAFNTPAGYPKVRIQWILYH